MNADAFLKEIAIQGVELWADGEQLRYRGPKSILTPDLLAEIKRHKAELLAQLASITYLPLAHGQKALWFLQQSVPENTAYNLGIAMRIRSHLDVAALRRALEALVAHQPALRTTFPMHDGKPLQAIHTGQKLSLAETDAQGWTGDELRRRVEAAHQTPFDLEHGPLLRLHLFAHAPDDHILVLSMHHIITDGWSVWIFVDELRTLYAAARANEPLSLPPLKRSYADYVREQSDLLASSEGTRLWAYWREQLAGELPLLNLPTDRPLPPVQRYRGATQYFKVNPAVFHRTKALARSEGATLFVTLLAAFQVLLHRYTGQEEVVVGTSASSRKTDEFNATMGYFINPVAIRSTITDNPTFKALLAQVRQTAVEALEHQDYPYALLMERLRLKRNLSHPPVFQVVFNLAGGQFSKNLADFFLPSDGATRRDEGELALEPFPIPSQEGAFFLTLYLFETKETVRGFLQYNTDLFDAPTIERMVSHFQQLLAGIAANPAQRIGELPLLTESEQHQLLVDWNDTAAPYPHDRCFHQLFEEQVARTPEVVAVVFDARGKGQGARGEWQPATHNLQPATLSYRELNQRANQLAHYLQALGVGPDVLVGLCVDRSPEMLIGLLGILKAGGAYLPLDPGYPQERLAWMLADAQPLVVLTQQHYLRTALPLSTPATAPYPIVCLDRDWCSISAESEDNPASAAGPENLAYVIYTSGSTGRPKGVLVSHRGLCNVVEAQIQTFQLRPEDRILQHFSLNFDAALSEITLAFGVGATLCLLPGEKLLPDAEFARLLRRLRITALILTPSALAALPAAALPDLHTLCVAGEACSAELVARWGEGRRFFNLYGPTETTIWATVAACIDDGVSPPIGRPILNTQLYVLDRHQQPVPIGAPGELYIGGVGVAHGYLNRPELTAEKFIPNPFGEGRLYRTGDRVRYRSDGNLDFLGRIDQQVKVRGYRIELGEIERTMMEHPQVQDCAVVVREDRPGDQQLIAYVVHSPQSSVNGDQSIDSAHGNADLIPTLRRFVQGKLPGYMAPSAFVQLTRLPLTPNGKLDRPALPAPQACPSSEPPAPQSQTEERLAAIWAAVLGLKRVGRQDHFFEIGGHSLRAVELMQRVHEQFAVTLSVHHFYAAPTVAEMAQVLDRLCLSAPAATSTTAIHPARSLPACLIPLQSGGTRPPFFCAHPVAGVVFPYYDLAVALGDDQPVYGLQAVGLAADEHPLASIESMAEHYIDAVRAVQPHGPYLLGGWSFGVHVAYEMAQQLHHAGQRVALLALIDTPPVPALDLHDLLHFTVTAALPSIWPYVFDYFHQVARRSRSSPDGTDGQEAATASWLRKWLRMANGWGAWLSAWHQLPEALRVVRVLRANAQAQFNYAPQPYPGRLTLFRTGQAYGASGHRPDLGWRALAQGGVEVYRAPGHHLNVLRKPNVPVLAGQLRHCLLAAANGHAGSGD